MSDIERAPAGVAHVYGDHIDTDRIIAGKYTKTLEQSHLAAHVLEDLDPEFAGKVQPGDILVAGVNFGCGPSREQAPLALQAAGISAVIAHSFARIFFRNSINLGLAVLAIGPHVIAKGATLSIDLVSGSVQDLTSDVLYQAEPLPPVMLEILAAGGLVAYMRNQESGPAEG